MPFYLLDALITLFFLVFSRYTVRWVVNRVIEDSSEQHFPEKVLIYGAGEIGCQLANVLERQQHYRVVGFIDDDLQLQKHVISGIKVYSPRLINSLTKKFEIESVLLAIPSATKE